MVNGLWKALLTSSTSIINEGKGKVFVKAAFLLGSPSRLFWSMSRINRESEEFRATKILRSILPPSVATEGGGICPSGESNFLGDLEELLF